MGWRAEGRAQVARDVRGGVLADAVGYGKTAITLGLIDASPASPPMLERFKGKAIDVKATLIVVPKHLMKQWPNELRKFLGNK